MPDDFLRYMRMNNIFGPTDPNVVVPGSGIPGITTGTFTGQDIRRPINPLESFQPETRAADLLFEQLQNPPVRNKPGIGRKIVGTMAGLGRGGIDAADRILYDPYYKQMEDYQLRMKPLEAAANTERYYNTNMRQLADSIMNRNIQQQRADATAQNADTTRMRAESYIALNNFKMQNPDWEIVKQEGGNYILINPKTGEAKDSGISTGTMNELDEINLRIKGQKEVAAIPRTVFSSGTSTTITPPEAEQPNQQKQRMINNATKFLNENPEFENAIEIDQDTGLPRVKPVGTRIQGSAISSLFKRPTKELTQEDFDRINEAINNPKPAVGNTITTSSRTTTSQRGGTAPKGTIDAKETPITTIRIRNKTTGQTGTMPSDKPIPNGWEKY